MSFSIQSLNGPALRPIGKPLPSASPYAESGTFITTIQRKKNLKKIIFKEVVLSNDLTKESVKFSNSVKIAQDAIKDATGFFRVTLGANQLIGTSPSYAASSSTNLVNIFWATNDVKISFNKFKHAMDVKDMRATFYAGIDLLKNTLIVASTVADIAYNAFKLTAIICDLKKIMAELSPFNSNSSGINTIKYELLNNIFSGGIYFILACVESYIFIMIVSSLHN